jgi:hypothetical protein
VFLDVCRQVFEAEGDMPEAGEAVGAEENEVDIERELEDERLP